MKDYLLHFKPILKERIWGGNYLNKLFNETSNNKIGEAWILSGHHEGDNLILNGKYKNHTLNEIYLKDKSLFGNSNYDKFPLLIKILDAKDDLSVQVHPDDLYAKKYYNDFGKNECWYVLDAKINSKIIYGHHPKNKHDFLNYINNNDWENALNYKNVKKDDFFFVPTGTVHAIGKGIKILEVQQSSDVTFRLYDYDRKDSNNQKRQLHINESLDVINYDFKPFIKEYETYHHLKRLVTNKYFTMDLINLNNNLKLINDDMYTIVFNKDKEVTCIINEKSYQIKANEAVLITALAKEVTFKGKSTIFIIKENKVALKELYKIK